VRPNVPIVDVPKFLRAALGYVDPVWKAARERGSWFYNGIGAASVGRTSLIWSLVEPFSLTEPRHAPHNRNITQLNAEVRQQLDIAGIPVLDGFRLCVDRFDCHPDNIHWCSSVQNAKVGILLTFARQLKEKLGKEERLMRTSEEIAAQEARAQQVAKEIRILDNEAEDDKAEESEKKRRKAVEEARARKKQEEEEEARRKREAVADKFAKFQTKGKKKFARGARMAPPGGDGGSGQCTKDSSGAEGAGTCAGPSASPPSRSEGTCVSGEDGTCTKPDASSGGTGEAATREVEQREQVLL